MKNGTWAAWWPWLIGICFLGLYGATAAPSVVALFDDSLEFQLVGPTFGIAHPTGYPLYILLSGLWSRILFPIGNWAWRVNLFSAVTAAGTLALIYYAVTLLIYGAHPRRVRFSPGSLAAVLGFGLGPIWWSQATIAEVYSLHGLLTSLILTVAIHLLQVDRDSPRVGRMVILLWALLGLGMTHHRTTVLLIPPLIVVLGWVYPALWRPQRAWGLWLLAALAPLLLYLWLPLRAAAGVSDLHGSYVNTWDGFWYHVLARGYIGFFGDNPLAIDRAVSDWFQLWLTQMGSVGFALGMIGLGQLAFTQGRRRAAWWLVVLVLLVNLIFTINYRVADAEVFLLPALLAFACLIGGGVALVDRVLQRWPVLRIGTVGLCLGLLLLGVSGRGPWVNRSQEWSVHDYAVALAKVPFPPESQVIALEGEATALRYFQTAEGLGENATAIVADDPILRQAKLAEFVEAGLPVYLTRELGGIESLYSFSGEGPLIRVWPRGEAEVGEPSQSLALTFAEDKLRLEGYELERLAQAGDPALRVAFYWRPTTTLTQTLKVSLRLQQPDGTPLYWPDGQPIQGDFYPLRLVAPTTTWVAGERIRDVYELPFPREFLTNPLPMQLVTILYDAESLQEVGTWSLVVE